MAKAASKASQKEEKVAPSKEAQDAVKQGDAIREMLTVTGKHKLVDNKVGTADVQEEKAKAAQKEESAPAKKAASKEETAPAKAASKVATKEESKQDEVPAGKPVNAETSGKVEDGVMNSKQDNEVKA